MHPALDETDRAWIAAWTPRFLEAHALALVDFHGVDAATMSRFRRAAGSAGARVVAVRNRRARELVRATPLAPMERAFAGPTAVVFVSRPYGPIRAVLRDGPPLRGVWIDGVETGLDGLVDPPPPAWVPWSGEDGGLALTAAELRATSRALRPWMQGAQRAEIELEDRLRLVHLGPNRVDVVRIVRRLADYGLREAWDLVQRAPVHLDTGGRSRPALEAVAAELRATGADATVLYGSSSPFTHEVDVDDGLFTVLRHVKLRPGHRLRARVHVSSGGSHSRVWSEAEGLAGPAARALVGDGTLESCVETSLLLRELGDFAAEWHGIAWRAHEIVDDPGAGPWTWAAPGPVDLRPRARRGEDGAIEVVLCTRCAVGVEQLTAFVDRYPPGSMEPEDRAVPLATGGPGYVF